MTIREAVDKRVKWLRLPHWQANTSLELPLLPNNQCGPWVIVRDPSGATPVLITKFLRDPEDRWEAAPAGQE